MAEAVRVQDLQAAAEIGESDLLVILQGGEVKSASGLVVKNFIEALGGIETATYDDATHSLTFTFTNSDVPLVTGDLQGAQGGTGPAGYTPIITLTPASDGWDVTFKGYFSDSGEIETRTIRIYSGQDTGDMRSQTYDPNNEVAPLSIPGYVTNRIASKLNNYGDVQINGTLSIKNPTTQAVNRVLTTAGGALTGYVANANGQVRNVFVSTADPSGGIDGDIWIKYEA